MKVTFKPFKRFVSTTEHYKINEVATQSYRVIVGDFEKVRAAHRPYSTVGQNDTVEKYAEKELYKVHYVDKHWVLVRLNDSMPIGVFDTIGAVVKHFSVDEKVLCLFEVDKPILKNYTTHYPSQEQQDKSAVDRDKKHVFDTFELYSQIYKECGEMYKAEPVFKSRYPFTKFNENHVRIAFDVFCQKRREAADVPLFSKETEAHLWGQYYEFINDEFLDQMNREAERQRNAADAKWRAWKGPDYD